MNRSISVIDFGPLKLICTHSGNAFGPALFQKPPAPGLPLRSPLFTALTGYPGTAYALDATARPPFACAATFVPGGGGGGGDVHASNSTMRDQPSGLRVINTRMYAVVSAGKFTRVHT